MKKVTLKDIANELGVTVGTVSHALNGIDDISEETKARVLEAAERLGYISNGLAASLRSGKTNTVAVIAPDISNPHLAYQIKLIEDMAKQLSVLKETNFASQKKATENKLQLCIIGIFIVFTILIFYLCITSMTGSVGILF